MEMNYQKALNILGLTDNFTDDELKKRYYKLAKEYHPDIKSDTVDAATKAEKFKELNAAKSYLENYLKNGSTTGVPTEEVPTQEPKSEEIERVIFDMLTSEISQYESHELYENVRFLITLCKYDAISLLKSGKGISLDLVIQEMHRKIAEIFKKYPEIQKRLQTTEKKVKKVNNKVLDDHFATILKSFGRIPLEQTERALEGLESHIKLAQNKSLVSFEDVRAKLAELRARTMSSPLSKKSNENSNRRRFK